MGCSRPVFPHQRKKWLKHIRNDVGGHFGHAATLSALSMLSDDACGSIAVEPLEDAVRLKLQFAGQIATTVLLKHLPNHDVAKFEQLLKDCILPAYEYAIHCVVMLVRAFLWKRFS
jgi:hypothetical protein